MKLISLKIQGFKNLDIDLDFTQSEGVSVFVGNNGSGKSNILEAISAIFYGLYNKNNFDPKFNFELSYEINLLDEIKDIKGNSVSNLNGDSVSGIKKTLFKIKQEDNFLSFYINNVNVSLSHEQIDKLLPENIIALYSGEETRLYESYYKDVFQNYIDYTTRDTKTSMQGIQSYPEMIFIDKDYWSIALLTIYMSIVSFDNSDSIYKGLSLILGEGIIIEKISFEINEDNLKKFKKNEITAFVEILQTLNNVTFAELRNFNEESGLLGRGEELFKNLSIACNQKDIENALISTISLELSNGVNVSHLSEGQKKQILIYFTTQILAKRDSIILLDEPDSYIHVGNKQRIKDSITNFLDITNEGEFIFTTHSPTLMHMFDRKHLFYLENGKLSGKEKREILNEITNGEISSTQVEIFLNSSKKYLLITEGISDKKHLEIAIEKLGIQDQYDIYPANCAGKVAQFINGIPSGMFEHKTIIGIFDYDKEGLDHVGKGMEKIEENKIYKSRARSGIYTITLPFEDEKFSTYNNFNIESYYGKELLESMGMLEKRNRDEAMIKCTGDDILSTREYPREKHLCFYKISEKTMDKNQFAEECRKLGPEKFEGFCLLFELIESIESY